MKKFLLSSATACLLVIAAATGVLAQNPPKTDVAKLDVVSTESKSSAPANDNIAVINSRAIKDFKKSYKPVADERWFKIDNGYIVKFMQDDIQHRADYDKKGNWIATTRYYEEKQLPKDVRSQVKSVYYDYKITSVQELTFPSHHVYLVNMEDEKTILIIRICDGDMDVFRELKKVETPKN